MVWPQLPTFLAQPAPACKQGLTSGGEGLLRRAQHLVGRGGSPGLSGCLTPVPRADVGREEALH